MRVSSRLPALSLGALRLLLAAGLSLAACGGSALDQSPGGTIAKEEPRNDRGGLWPTIDRFQTLRFDHYSVEEGLSQSSGLCLLQDSTGYTWIGTEDGLNRFDGSQFTIYRADPDDPASLSNNYIQALAQDADGTIWVGTYGGGLDRLDPATGTFTHYRHDPLDPSSLADDQILALYVDDIDRVWIGFRAAGLDRLEPDGAAFQHYASDPTDPNSLSSNQVTAIVGDPSGAIWIGTSEGLNQLDPLTGEFTRLVHDPRDPNSLAADPVLSLYYGQRAELWIGTVRGLDRYSTFSDHFTHYPYQPIGGSALRHPSVNAILQDNAGGLWIGTDGDLSYLNPTTGSFVYFVHDPIDPDSLSRNEVNSLLMDEAGGLWVGTYGGGLNYSDPRRAWMALYQPDPSAPGGMADAAIWGLLEDSAGILWIGTDGAGLQSFDRSSGEWKRYLASSTDPYSLPSNVVMGVDQDRLGNLWLSTAGGGLSRLDRNTGQFTTYRYDPEDPTSLNSDVVWFAREDDQGNLWVGTAMGLDRFDRRTGQFTHYVHDPDDPNSLSDNNIGSFYQDSTGAIWVGSHNGLNRLDPNTGRFERFLHDPQDPGSISHNIVFAIHEDASGTLWMGTWGGGLNRFDRQTETFVHYRVRDGLPNDVIYGIMEDARGYLWMTTNNGLSRFDPKAEQFVNFDRADGLQSNEFSYNGYFQSPTGEMFVAGIEGFNIFRPEQLDPSPYQPPIVISSLSSEGQSVDLGQDIELAWPSNGFDFEYAALNFSKPESIQYAYRLAGFEDDWNYVGSQRFGRYTNLSGGDYQLQVKATNQDGIWNKVGASLAIRVVPPFWMTWWFAGLVVLAAGAGIFGVVRLRINAVEKRSRELAAQVRSRTRTLEQRTKQLDRRRKELEALYQADEQLLSRLDLDEVLQALVDTAIEILGADKGGVLVWDPRSDELVVRASRGFSAKSIASVRFVPGSGIVGRVFESGEPIAVEDTQQEPRATKRFVDAEQVRAFLQVPIKIGDEVYGVFSADYLAPRRFDQDTVQLLMSLASHAAMAIENARLYADTEYQITQLTALHDTARALASTLALHDLLALIIRQATSLLSADGGMVNLVLEGEPSDEVVAAVGIVEHTVGLQSSLEHSLSGWVTRNNRPTIVNQVAQDQRVDRSYPELLESVAAAAVAPLAIKDRVIGTLAIVGTQEGKGRFDEQELDTLVAFANQAAIAIENARLYEAEQRRADQFQLLLDLGSRLASILSPDELRIQISRLVRGTLGYQQVSFGLIEGEDVVFHSGSGQFWEQLSREPLRLPINGRSLSSWVIQHAKPLVVPDVRHDPRYFFLPGDTETRSEVVVPLRVKDQVIGVLAASSDRSNAFDQSDVAVLQTLADQSATAIENARLYTQAGEVAALEERARLARDLHDAVTQTLFSASLIAEALPTVWKDDPAEGGQLLQELRKLNTGALAEMRSLLLELRPAALEESDICDLLRQLGDVIVGRSGIEVRVETRGDCRVPSDVHVTLYRIAQEAMNNISKHAKASLVEVLLEGSANGDSAPAAAPKSILLRIRDDGQGFDPRHMQTEGLGLKIIRERVESIGAQLDIESEPGQGTTMLVQWEENGNV